MNRSVAHERKVVRARREHTSADSEGQCLQSQCTQFHGNQTRVNGVEMCIIVHVLPNNNAIKLATTATAETHRSPEDEISQETTKFCTRERMCEFTSRSKVTAREEMSARVNADTWNAGQGVEDVRRESCGLLYR